MSEAYTPVWGSACSGTKDDLFPKATPGDESMIAEGGVAAAVRGQRVGILTNPRSGGNRRGLEPVVVASRRIPGCVHHMATTPEEIAEALAALAAEQVDLLVINGGDGTIQAALTTLVRDRPFRDLPMLAVPRSGTGSLTARDVGLRGSREAGLRRLVAWAREEGASARIVTRPVLDISDPGRSRHVCGMFFGVGAIYQGIEYYHRRLHTAGLRGEVGPGIALVRLLVEVLRGNRRSLPPVRIATTLDGTASAPQECVFALASGLERLFLGLRPYFGSAGPGALHYVAMRTAPRHLLRVLPRLARGRPHRLGTPDNGYLSRDANEIELDFTGGFTVDGELYRHCETAGPLVIRAAGPVRFLQV